MTFIIGVHPIKTQMAQQEGNCVSFVVVLGMKVSTTYALRAGMGYPRTSLGTIMDSAVFLNLDDQCVFWRSLRLVMKIEQYSDNLNLDKIVKK